MANLNIQTFCAIQYRYHVQACLHCLIFPSLAAESPDVLPPEGQ